MNYSDLLLTGFVIILIASVLNNYKDIIIKDSFIVTENALHCELLMIKYNIEKIANTNGGTNSLIFLSMQNEWKNKYKYDSHNVASLINKPFLKNELKFKDKEIQSIKDTHRQYNRLTILQIKLKKVIRFLYFVGCSIFVSVLLVQF